jgi:RNA polymerase sigma-70 factor, ECF subfamily
VYPSGEDDKEILRLAQAGEAGAFDALVLRLTPDLYRIVRRMMPDRAEAEAVVQETWLRAWGARSRLDASRPALPWLARIATNAARDQWRKRRPLDFADVGGEIEERRDEADSPESHQERRELIKRLAAAVDTLRPEWRMILALRHDGGLSYDEIAEALGLPLNTVRTHLRRAHLALRRRLEAEDG